MARNFTPSAKYASKALAIATAPPISIAGWVNANWAFPMSFHIYDGSSNGFTVYGDSSLFVNAESKQGGSNSTATTTAQVTSGSSGTWQHVGAVFASTTSRTAYVNGVASTANTLTSSPAGLNITYLGGDPSGNATDGSWAFLGCWNTILSGADFLSLFQGASPRLVHPEALISYPRLTGGASPEPDLVSSTAWTLTGASIESPNPRIYRP